MAEIKEIKIIGRISKAGKEYFQHAVESNPEENRFVPVFKKQGLEKFEIISQEKKIDKNGVVYTLYTLPRKNVFLVPKEDGTDEIARAVIMK